AASDVVNLSNVKICDPITFTAGTLAVTGALNISGQLVEGVGNSVIGTLSGTGDVTIGGLFTWNFGVVKGSGQVNANGGLNIAVTGSAILDGRQLNNAGLAVWPINAGGNISFQNGAVFNNNGTFDVREN